MRKHPQIGHDVIAGIPFLREAAEIILAHHERFDGSGYPHALRGAEIPLEARIFAAVDTLDAITSDRPYRRALPFSRVLEEIDQHQGKQFDPEVGRVFLSIPRSDWESLAGRHFA